jgi:hypothetical protein
MPVLFMSSITREFVRSHQTWFFVFGDNLVKKGLGGQAREMRGEPNAVGIATKRSPSMNSDAFFSDSDIHNVIVMDAIKNSFRILESHLLSGGVVVIPKNGVGGGLANLPVNAPLIDTFIKGSIERLANIYGLTE